MAIGAHGLQHAHTTSSISWKSILVQFVLGGTIVALISFIVARASTKTAALVYSLPLTFIPVLVFVWKHADKSGTSNPGYVVQEYMGQSLAGILLLVFFLAALYWLTAASLAQDQASSPHVRLSGAQLIRNIMLALLFMAVPMVWFYYFVCDAPMAPSEVGTRRACYFG